SRSCAHKKALFAPSVESFLEHLGPRLARDALLVTDSHAADPAFAREAGCEPGCCLSAASPALTWTLTSAGAGRWMASVLPA
ncbi:hypothetical protein AB4084_38930, partial [Lysobacter sp. 2RAB21]